MTTTNQTDSSATSGEALYVECRECNHCGHVGINDSSDTLAACHNCDWSGATPTADHCPGCADSNCMGAACPKCGEIYTLLAEGNLRTPALQAATPLPGRQDERALFEHEALRLDIVDEEGLERRESGEYVDEPAQAAWAAWQAARKITQQAAPEAPEAVIDQQELVELAAHKVISRFHLRGLFNGLAHNAIRILGYELRQDLERVLQGRAPASSPQPDVTAMVNRFLGWRLPKDFYPDCGITFKHNETWGPYPNNWPIGTNLLTADQARAMFEYVLVAPVAAPEAPASSQDEMPGMWEPADVSGGETDMPPAPQAASPAAPIYQASMRGGWEDIERWQFDLHNDKGDGSIKTRIVYAVPHAATTASTCTCPSGDGSLRWPCPQHPPEATTASASESGSGDIVHEILSIFQSCGFEVRQPSEPGLSNPFAVCGSLDSAAVLLETLLTETNACSHGGERFDWPRKGMVLNPGVSGLLCGKR